MNCWFTFLTFNYLCTFDSKSNSMKFYFSYLLVLFFILASCNNESEKRTVENIKEAKKQEVIFENISKAWDFSNPTLNPASQSVVNNWNEWRLFLDELNTKPKSSIGAFQKKSKALSKRVLDLNNNIPQKFNKPEIKSRIAVLTTKINSINLFINLRQIPDQKIKALIAETNVEIASLSQQMDEIVRKEAIPLEEGESDMIRMLDTSRAIPTTKTIRNNIRNNKRAPQNLE